jgi:hypothetical protein
MDMVGPQPTLVALLVRHVLLPREFLPQIEINSTLARSIQPDVNGSNRFATPIAWGVPDGGIQAVVSLWSHARSSQTRTT